MLTYGPGPNPRIGGGQFTDAWDFADFMQMLLDRGRYDGQTVLTPGSVDAMKSSQTFGAKIVNTPNPGVDYGLGTWLDVVGADGQTVQIGAYGAFGFSAWADYSRGLVGVFSVEDQFSNVRQFVRNLQEEIRDTVPVTVPPKVQSVVVDDGTAQRSRVESLTVRFDRRVTLPDAAASAFTLTGPGGAVALTADVSKSTASQTVVTLTFPPLQDGRFTLSADAAMIWAAGQNLDGAANGSPGGGFSFALHRLAGDFTGDAAADFADFLIFRGAFGTAKGQVNYLAVADFDGDHDVDFNDFLQFRSRFGVVLP